MDNAPLKHFDYLIEHDGDLEIALGLSNLSKNINHWRRYGMEYPDSALVGCRKMMEAALKTLAKPLPDERMDLREIIDYAENKGIIDKSMALKCHEIRKKGNQGAHNASVKAIDAQMILDLLDDFLRWCAEYLKIIPVHLNSAFSDDPIFIVKTSEEVSEMSKKAKLAATLDDNKEIEKKARKAKRQIEAYDDSSKSDLQKMLELYKQAEEIGISAADNQDEETLAAQKQLFDGFEEKITALSSEKQAISTNFDDVNTEIQEILNEHDFIRKLLHGDKQATVEQHDVMAFPKGSNSVTNILQIAGGAGTGKTLCLLAKVIAEIDDRGQEPLFGEPGKEALFICFNKGLANYVRGILASYEGYLPDIDVIHYDLFINQLVRQKPKTEYAYLADYAQDVRYPRGQIIYGLDKLYIELLQKAQRKVAERHPERAKDYYLDQTGEGFDWLKDELSWIEARFMNHEEAIEKYPKAERTGRGTKRRPSEAMRQIILEIWIELNQLLETSDRYTIEQATKRLLGSNSLPAYDAIAIDEVQDFSLLSIRLLLRFRRSDNSKVFLSGDENQKIYQRDFTWKELDEGLRGHTITLEKNMRNSSAIRCFSDRLLGVDCPHEKACNMVHIENADDSRIVELLRKLAAPERHETTALISNKRSWYDMLRSANVPITNTAPGNISHPGLYLLGDLMGKGLEFDNVVVDYAWEISEDEEEEKRLRYVHFTRARKRLYIRYQGTPPKLLVTYYSDFLN